MGLEVVSVEDVLSVVEDIDESEVDSVVEEVAKEVFEEL